jgi:hypothetical protein
MSAMIPNPNISRFVYAIAIALALTTACIAQQPVEQVVQSANKFLSTLSDAERSKVVYDFNDNTQRARWSNFPTGFVPRGGMSLKQMSATQKAAALDLMKIVLSSRGYEKVSQIRMADDDFKTNGSKRGPRGGGWSPAGRRPTTERQRRPSSVWPRWASTKRSSWRRASTVRSRQYVRERPLLHLPSRETIDDRALDAAVRRPSPRVEHYDHRQQRHHDTVAHRGAARHVQRSTVNPSDRLAVKATKHSPC